MKSTLYLKFIILYIVFGFLSVFTVATFSDRLIADKLIKDEAFKIYQTANVTAAEYLPDFFTEDISTAHVTNHLDGMMSHTGANVWFVNQAGEVITYSSAEGFPAAPSSIEGFDPTEIGTNQYMLGNYHGYFKEDLITVLAPVTEGYSTKGYLLVHKPLNDINDTKDILLKTIYLTLTIVYILSFVILLGFHFFVYRPLTQVTEAAKQYASGNLDYEIPVRSHDEMGYLSASLNYMSSQIKDMEDYQKKFVANVSHDFRSPLTSIKGYVEAMADGTIPPEFQEKYLNIILFETERLTDLTKDLLMLNEFDKKNLLLDKEDFDLHVMIKQVVAPFEQICTQKRISIELLFAGEKLVVHADKRKIQQVLYNLVDNAIKFSELNSTITIETTTHGDKVYTSIKDEGIGIPKASLGKIWERFYKTDLSRGKDKKGTGLGLAIVKEAISAHGENISVMSTEGVGTEFTFTLTKS